MDNDQAFSVALRVFNKTRAGAVECLRSAINAFHREEMRQIKECLFPGLEFHIADTESGRGVTLVVTGFKNEEDAELFVTSRLHASRQ